MSSVKKKNKTIYFLTKKFTNFHRYIKKLKINKYNHATTIVKKLQNLQNFHFYGVLPFGFSILFNEIAISTCSESFVKIT